VEAVEGQGQVRVRTQYVPATRTIVVGIEDTGVGMSEETLSRVFDLFFTTKREGTGLGMAIARSVIDLHGGELGVQSAPGQGTSIRVRLPVSPGAGGAGGPA
jgi:two-component system NtrC family sensor kinase